MKIFNVLLSQVRGSSSARSPSVTSCGCSLYSDTGTATSRMSEATSRMSTSMSGTLRRRESRASPGSGYTSNTDSYASQTQVRCYSVSARRSLQ